VPNRDAADARRATGRPAPPAPVPTASWKRPTTEGGAVEAPSAPAVPVAPAPSTPVPPKAGIPPLVIGVLIGLGVAVVALLIVLILT
jgi:hypothetical protein